MADVNRGNRPLSPHLTIYRPQITSMLSILMRITGVGLTLGSLLTVWWFLAAATGPEYYDYVNGIVTSWFGGLIMLGSLWALWYHFCNGLRYLLWFEAKHFDVDKVTKSGQVVVAASLILTLLTLIIIL
ncbi:MAG: succinate dehydrogenase, cytochrome b556 subunit [Pseudomonadota bacterium]